jgi:hypothetical protein
VKTWLTAHPRFHFHFTPTGASWLNLVERFFAEITRKRLRGTFRSVPALAAAIRTDIREHNKDPRPFIWTASASRQDTSGRLAGLFLCADPSCGLPRWSTACRKDAPSGRRGDASRARG